MQDVLKLWLVLFPSFVFGRIFLSAVGFNHIDLRFENFVQLLVVPLVQSALVALGLYGFPLDRLSAAFRDLWKQPVCRKLMIFETTILTLFISTTFRHRSEAWISALQHYCWLTALAVGLLFIATNWVARKSRPAGFEWNLLGLGLLLFGLSGYWSWPDHLAVIFFSPAS